MMKASDQGVTLPGKQRYQAIPRTLTFLTSLNPQSGAQEVLLLKGAPTKRLWANRYNGLGGHVEAGEDIYAAAEREVREETGLEAQLALRGVINIQTGADTPGVLIFVFGGRTGERQVRATPEGTPEWIPLAVVEEYPLVDDLYEVIPRALAGGDLFYGHYAPQTDGTMVYRFR